MDLLQKLGNNNLINEIKIHIHCSLIKDHSNLLNNLIQKQQKLQKLRINSETFFLKIVSSSELKFEKLISLTLFKMDLKMISFKNFKIFKNLNELIFIDCKEMSMAQCNSLVLLPFELETLCLSK